MAAEIGMEDPTVGADAGAADATGGSPGNGGADPVADGPTSTPATTSPSHRLQEVEEALRSDPRSFGFFRAVRLLEQLRPDREEIGGDANPSDEVVQLGANPALAFPTSEIAELNLPADGLARMAVNFMGLTGPQGLLPHHYTLMVMERLRRRDDALRDFLDIFQHRALSLFYRGWQKNRFALLWEKHGTDPLSEHLLDLVGMGLPALQSNSPVPVSTLASFAGLLGPQPRGALALEELLAEYFDVPCSIEQFVGGWYRLEGTDLCEIGDEEGDANRLGLGAVAGDEVWDAQARARVRLGPLDRERFDAFLPTGDAFEALRAILRFFGHDRTEFEVQLVLEPEEVSGLVIGEADQPLGWSTWIRTGPAPGEADRTILYL